MTPSPADKLTVHRGSPPSNRYVWSPFVTKLEARLRFDGVAYRLGAGSPRSAPKGKIPYVDVRLDDGEHDETRVESLADSTLIIRALVQRGMLHDVNAGLQPAQRAHDLAVRAMLEDRVYFYGSREKWRDNYYAMRAHVLAAVPWPLQVLVGWLAYRGVESGLHGQGTGRLEHEEVQTLKLEVWESINALLVEARRSAGSGPDDEPFWILGGAEPTEADATAYGFVAGALICEAAPVTTEIIRGYPTIVAYANNIHGRYFPDYERWE